MNGEGIGRDLILKYAPSGSLGEREFRSAIATLKADGGNQRMIEQVTEQVLREREIAEQERRLRAAVSG